jgi:hypothetical protein
MTTPNQKSEHKSGGRGHGSYTSSHKTAFHSKTHKSELTLTMKLLLLVVASLLNLSSGAFMAELRGPLNEEACTGTEYADFKQCATLGAESDSSLPVLAELEEEAFVNRGGERQLGWCSGCTGGAPRGTFCFTVCGGRRLSEEGMATPNLRRLERPEFVAVFEDGAYTGNGKSKRIAEAIIGCLGGVSTNHPCLGTTDKMTLTVTL